MDFPTCWDGRTDSPDHKSHVVYADLDDDSCPESHPQVIPTVQVSIFIKDYDGGWHTWSDGTANFHTDYLSGWDPADMQKMINGCTADPEECHNFVTYKNGPVGDYGHDE